ncbi:hypothetical protein ACGYK5_16135, partial [Sulfitobacter sp. 1A16787]|uniref:hypothetical protein n=1 Tax=Sulfitobacter sp. 1A16787 TaxID=3368571 RepID=UPI003745DDA8
MWYMVCSDWVVLGVSGGVVVAFSGVLWGFAFTISMIIRFKYVAAAHSKLGCDTSGILLKKQGEQTWHI